MAKIAKNLTELIGGTPLMRIQPKVRAATGYSCQTGVFQSGGQCERPRGAGND